MLDGIEYRAGTDPTNQESVLTVLTVTAPGTAQVTVLWQAVPGRTYQVQYKDNLEDATWTDLSETVMPVTTTGAVVDTTAESQVKRFYRVVLVE